jgi:hypothetical protein
MSTALLDCKFAQSSNATACGHKIDQLSEGNRTAQPVKLAGHTLNTSRKNFRAARSQASLSEDVATTGSVQNAHHGSEYNHELGVSQASAT